MVSITNEDNIIRIIFSENCDITEIADDYNTILELFNQKINSEVIDRIIIETENITNIDTSFLQLLISLIKTINRKNIKISLKKVNDEVKDILNIYGVKLNKRRVK